MLRAYRAILRLHRARLPPDVRAIGDAGVHSEFRAWGGSQASADEWRSFEGEWSRYIQMLQEEDVDATMADRGDIPAKMRVIWALETVTGGRTGGLAPTFQHRLLGRGHEKPSEEFLDSLFSGLDKEHE